MIEEFEAAYQYDPNIVSISFSEKQGKFSIEILVSNKQEAVEMHDKLFALRRIYDMSPPKDVLSPIKQNFDIACNEENGTVTLTGNIFNAFKLLRETELISANLAEAVLVNSKISSFLSRTKDFVLPGNEAHVEKSSSLNKVEASIQEPYAEALSKLRPDEMQEALSELALILASKGTNVEITVQEHPKKSPAVH